jgi:hypothetical protein
MDRPFTMSFQGGTMLDALGAVVRSYGEAIWQFGDVSEGDSILIVSPPEMGGGNATAHLGPFQSK